MKRTFPYNVEKIRYWESMKVVITGANSYIGDHIQSYIENNDNRIEICQLDVVGEQWREFDFSGYDTVVHAAAIVHRKDVDSWDLYKKVNVDLTVEIAQKAKKQGVKQFVFLSSMAVYGVEKSLWKKKSVVTSNTELKPSAMYGKSKYLAEQELLAIEDETFKIVIVRLPNVYGPGCRGGYISTYAAIVSKLPAIPKAFTEIKQSVLYIDNLSRFIYLLIVQKQRGIYTPQDAAGVSAVDIMQYISKALQLNKKSSCFLGIFIYLFSFCSLIIKGYGGVAYSQEMSHQEEFDYLIVSGEEGIARTVLYSDQRNNSNI